MPASEPARGLPGLKYFIAGLLHAAAMLLAFPPVGVWGFALVAPVPLVWAGWRRGRDLAEFGRRGKLGRAPLMVMLGVAPLHLYAHQWVIDVSAMGYPFFVLIMSAKAAIVVWSLSVVNAKWRALPLAVVAPVIWAGFEVFRGEVFFDGYPWLLAAHPLVDAPLIPATAALLGAYFTGFLVVMAGAAVLDVAIGQRKPGVACVAAGVIAISVGLGAWLSPGGGVGALRIGVVQTNVPQSNKLEWTFEDRMRDFAAFAGMTRNVAAGSDVIVWPETMFPGVTLSESGLAAERAAGLTFRVPAGIDARGEIPSTEFHDRLMALSVEVARPLVVGAVAFDGLAMVPEGDGGVRFDYKKRYNSAFLVERGQVDPQPYSKMELTPFGEIMPGIHRVPWLQRQLVALGAGGMVFDLSSGSGPRHFEIGAEPRVALVTPICFEATKPGLCRRLVRAAGDRPVVMVNLTNDGWFGAFKTGRLHHLQIARWRCVELGVPMVRAANTGISAAIDHRGRVIASGVEGVPGAWNEGGVLAASVNPNRAGTVYARVGNVFGWGMFAVMLGALVVSLVGGRGTLKENRA